MPNEQEEFLKDLNPDTKSDVLTEPLVPPEAEKPTEEQAETDEDKFNRRERRLAAKLQAERESSIALAARLEALTEAQKFSRENTPEVDETIARIYGTNTPEAAEATALLQKALTNAENRATEKALEKFREEQQREQEAVAKEEKSLDAMIDDIEDETGQTLDKQTRHGFFQLLEKLSPKDKDGNIIAYADHTAVWEELQVRRQPQQNRAKDLAARSMVSTGASPKTTVEADSNERWLRENGLI